MSDPSTDNKVASVINQILKALIEGTGEELIRDSVIASNPWVGLPFIRQIFDHLLSWFGQLFYQQMAIGMTKLIIDIQVNLEASKTYDAFQSLQMAVASGDKNAIEQASKNLDDAYASLIHYDGSASP